MKLKILICKFNKFPIKLFSKLTYFFKLKFFRIKILIQFKSKKDIVISVIRDFFPPPYGGGNQFMLYLLKNLREAGYRVKINSFDKDVNIFIADYCWFNKKYQNKIVEHKTKFNSKLIHRVDGLLSKYREDGINLDKEAQYLNRFADSSVIQSEFTKNQFKIFGYQFKRSVIIHNSVDRNIFNNIDSEEKNGNLIVSASWSNNKQKGMKDYLWLDKNLREDINYNFIGNLDFIPRKIKLKPPMRQRDLAIEFKKADLFIFCAENESCSNVLLEALACGLPVICKNSGGSPEVINDLGLLYENIEEVPEKINYIFDNLSFYNNLFKKNIIKEAYREYINLINTVLKKS